MPKQTNNTFENIMTRIKKLPLWIKQVIYVELKDHLMSSSARFTLETIQKEDSLQLYIPQCTFLGKQELETRSKSLPIEHYRLLDSAIKNHKILDICLENGWTLEDCSKTLLDCIDQEFVSPPVSNLISGTAEYTAGRIKLGEFLIKMNKISIDQLDQALKTQKYISHSIGERTGIAEVLINVGYVSKEDTEGILFLKEESKKRYIPEIDNSMHNEEINKLKKENLQLKGTVNRLIEENKQVREQIKKLLKLK